MICPKCGAENAEGSVFCIKCGANLTEAQNVNPQVQAPVDNNVGVTAPVVESVQTEVQSQPVQPVAEVLEPVVQQPAQPAVNTQQTSTSVNTSPLNYLMYIIAVLLKPVKSFKDEKDKLSNPQTSLIFSAIVIVAMTVIKLLTTIYNTVHYVSYFDETEWMWDRLKEFNWFKVIGQSLLLYAGIIFGLSVIFYLGGLIIKKQVNFIRNLSITSTAIVPAVLCMFILSPIGSLISPYVGVFFSIAGFVYTISIFCTLISEEFELSGDIKVYFFAACFTVFACIAFYAINSIISSAISSSVGRMMGSFLG